MNKIFVYLFFWLGFIQVNAQPLFPNAAAWKWADSTMKSMSSIQRAGQLFMVAAYSNKGLEANEGLMRLIKNNGIGGLIFMQGGPGRQLILTRKYQAAAKVPLLISADAEWGLAMRLDSTLAFPYAMTLGAIQDLKLIQKTAERMAVHCRRIGITMNMAPVVDVNVNPKNPIINGRSFGENPKRVAELGVAFMKGLQAGGVMASAKHFPGHGDTEKDSHLTLPEVPHSRARLDSIELLPFRELIKNRCASVMVAHLAVPALTGHPSTPTTLSKKVVTELLKQEMGYEGLAITDALNMKGVAEKNQPGAVDVAALLAGNDILLFSENVPKALSLIENGLADGSILQSDIDEKCRKILAYKFMLGLHQGNLPAMKNLASDLNTDADRKLFLELYEKAITLLQNQNNRIPLQRLDTLKPVLIEIGSPGGPEFYQRLNDYMPVARLHLPEEASAEQIEQVLQQAKKYNLAIVGMHRPGEKPFRSKSWGNSSRLALERIQKQMSSILFHFSLPYNLASLPSLKRSSALIQAYQDTPASRDMAAQALFGGIGIQGRLPVGIPGFFKEGDGIDTKGGLRLRYGDPADVGLNPAGLKKIDLLMAESIQKKHFPGAQLLVAKDGMVVYQKSFGTHTYEKDGAVENSHLYDLASITKVAGCLPQIMRLVDEGKIDLNKTLGDYLPELNSSNKGKLVLRDILSHQAQLKAWIPFYQKTMLDGQLNPEYYRSAKEKGFELPVASNIFAINSLTDSIYTWASQSPLLPEKKYVYSDLGYYFLTRIVEKFSGNERLDGLHKRFLAHPLGAKTLTYLPLNALENPIVVPTENDRLFRKQLIQGFVHDQGAAMCGGVAGHAGLFSNTNDLAKLVQMFLNLGTYGGERFIQESTIKEFIKCQFCKDGNRRGVGFDKPSPNGNGGTACDCVSYLSFGHSGFTGTLVWADPQYNLIFIFLSNRVHPDAENKGIIKEEIRAKTQQIVYDAIMQS
ncbi:MAG: serine hydrolase [Bacteroidetes bacterium]|nr:serine hydrolase [Bacteroidota bacterium]